MVTAMSGQTLQHYLKNSIIVTWFRQETSNTYPYWVCLLSHSSILATSLIHLIRSTHPDKQIIVELQGSILSTPCGWLMYGIGNYHESTAPALQIKSNSAHKQVIQTHFLDLILPSAIYKQYIQYMFPCRMAFMTPRHAFYHQISLRLPFPWSKWWPGLRGYTQCLRFILTQYDYNWKHRYSWYCQYQSIKHYYILITDPKDWIPTHPPYKISLYSSISTAMCFLQFQRYHPLFPTLALLYPEIQECIF